MKRASETPQCLHGEIWKACETCARMVWCEDCGGKITLDELDEPLHPKETVTCEKCVDRMIGKNAA